MKDKKNILYIFIAVLFILAIIIFIVKHNDVNPESKLAQKAYAILGNDSTDLCSGLPFYQDENLTYDKLDTDTKLCLAYRMLTYKDMSTDELEKSNKSKYCYLENNQDHGFRTDNEKDTCEVQILSADKLNIKYKEIFGKSIEKNTDFSISGSKACYFNEEKGSYTCGNAIKQTHEVGWAPTTYRVISKAKKRGKQLYIYDYYLMINSDICYKTNDGIVRNNECSDKYTVDTKITSRFVAKYGTKYVHIFKKDKDDNYYWVNTKSL